MFIGNHTIMGMLDTPLLMLGIYVVWADQYQFWS